MTIQTPGSLMTGDWHYEQTLLMEAQTDWLHTHSLSHTHTHTHTHTHRHTQIQTDRQTDRQTHTHACARAHALLPLSLLWYNYGHEIIITKGYAVIVQVRISMTRGKRSDIHQWGEENEKKRSAYGSVRLNWNCQENHRKVRNKQNNDRKKSKCQNIKKIFYCSVRYCI